MSAGFLLTISMKILELFAGTRSFGKAAEKFGHEVYSSDINEYENIDYVTDILDFKTENIPFKPDIIWASPPCTAFSVLRISYNWNHDHTPKTEGAKLGIKIVKKTLEIIKELNPIHWYMENPRGKLRKLDIVKNLPRVCIWYCQYGSKNAKPTDIWSNNIHNLFNTTGWIPRAKCFNGRIKCHHDKCPRGNGKDGVQGQSNNIVRSIVPEELCMDILKSYKIKGQENLAFHK